MGGEKQICLSFSDTRLPAWFVAYLVSVNRKELTLVLTEHEVKIENAPSGLTAVYAGADKHSIALMCPMQRDGHCVTQLFQIGGKDIIEFPKSWEFLQKDIKGLDICMTVIFEPQAECSATQAVVICYKETVALIPDLLSLKNPYVKMFQWENSYTFEIGGCFQIREFLMGVTVSWEAGRIKGSVHAIHAAPSVLQFLEWIAEGLVGHLQLDWLKQWKKIFDVSIRSACVMLDSGTGKVTGYTIDFGAVLFGMHLSVSFNSLEQLVLAQMQEQEGIMLKQIISGLPNGFELLPTEMENLTVSNCQIQISLAKKNFSFQGIVREVCSIAGFELEEVSFSVESGSSSRFQVWGTVQMQDMVKIRLTMDYRGKDAWMLNGQIELTKPLDLPQVPFLISILPSKAQGRLVGLEAIYENGQLMKASARFCMERPQKKTGELVTEYKIQTVNQEPVLVKQEIVPEHGSLRAGDGIRWYPVQRQLGPAILEQIGVAFDETGLYVAIEAGICLGPVRIDVSGLMAGYDFTKKAVTGRLDGLALSCQTSAFAFGGAIYRDRNPSEGAVVSYSGTLSLKLAKWELGALASYAECADGSQCLFVFLNCQMTLAATPVFVITGLMGGVGIHWNLKIPDVEEVEQFPLLKMNKTTNQKQVLDALKQWLTPSPGNYWAALGIRFQMCGLLDGEVLLTLLAGKEFCASLCGSAALTLPKGSKKENAYAYVRILIAAILRPQAGIFTAKAALSGDSFLLSKDCHLMGEAAFCLWFGSHKNAGDFVFSVGGYDPQFRIPEHYPKLKAVGFSWQISNSVSAKGNVYAAVTPSCIMAGGSLEFLYRSGAVQAWFTAYAHFLMNWHPFYFHAGIGVEIGVSLRLNLLFCHKTIRVTVGASLELWGPPVGGTVRIKLCFLTIPISFGKSEDKRKDSIDWKEFRATLLSEKNLHKMETVSGVRTQGEGCEEWVSENGRFSMLCTTCVPIGNISIRPMGISGVSSVWQVIVIGPDGVEQTPEAYGLLWEEEMENLPEALWGEGKGNPAAAQARMIKGKTKGKLSVPQPIFSGEILIENYQEALVESLTLPNPLWKEVEAEPVWEHGTHIEATQSLVSIQQIVDQEKIKHRNRMGAYLNAYYLGITGDFARTGRQCGQLYKDFPRIRKER